MGGARTLKARGPVANQNSCQGGRLSQLMSSLPGTGQACQTKGRVSSEIHQQEVRLAFLLSSLQNIQIYFLPGNNGKKSDLINISFEGWCLLSVQANGSTLADAHAGTHRPVHPVYGKTTEHILLS